MEATNAHLGVMGFKELGKPKSIIISIIVQEEEDHL